MFLTVAWVIIVCWLDRLRNPSETYKPLLSNVLGVFSPSGLSLWLLQNVVQSS